MELSREKEGDRRKSKSADGNLLMLTGGPVQNQMISNFTCYGQTEVQ